MLSRRARRATDRVRSHQDKTGYRKEQQATRAAQEVNEHIVLKFSSLVPYQCRHCPMYHIGHERVEVRA